MRSCRQRETFHCAGQDSLALGIQHAVMRDTAMVQAGVANTLSLQLQITRSCNACGDLLTAFAMSFRFLKSFQGHASDFDVHVETIEQRS